MNVRQWAINQLMEHGMWEKEATAVVDEYAASEAGKSMSGAWNGQMIGYPKQFHAVLLMTLKSQALEWVEKNKPMHFCKPMLES